MGRGRASAARRRSGLADVVYDAATLRAYEAASEPLRAEIADLDRRLDALYLEIECANWLDPSERRWMLGRIREIRTRWVDVHASGTTGRTGRRTP